MRGPEIMWSKTATTTSTFPFLKSATDTKFHMRQTCEGAESYKRTTSCLNLSTEAETKLEAHEVGH